VGVALLVIASTYLAPTGGGEVIYANILQGIGGLNTEVCPWHNTLLFGYNYSKL
jgi:hypothetical protein